MLRITLFALPALLALLPAASAPAEEAYSRKTQVTPLIATSETIIGQPLAYPEGKPQVTAVIVTVPPGGETGWHEHAVPLFGYMLDGVLTADRRQGTRVYHAGDSFMESMDCRMTAPIQATPVRILAVYMGAEGVPM
jgi:quercetin dioxygenase-like cupin family protein